MDWTSLYLNTKDLNVFILGTGEVATRRAQRFLSHGANVKLAGSHIDESIADKAQLYQVSEAENLVKWADIVVIASGNEELSDKIASLSSDKLLNRADFPDMGDIIVPTSFNIGDVEISIYTGGKSPLMAKYLRKKIQSIITEEDIREIELQSYARTLLKSNIQDQKTRKDCLYEIFEDEKIKDMEIDEAKKYIGDLIDSKY